jgi:hypothetical protein
MRIERSVTSVSWIPSEAMTGPMRLPMDLGIGHYDSPPPDHIDPADLGRMRDKDLFRFANHLGAWIEAEDGAIVDAGYFGNGFVGSTIAKLGVSLTVPGVSFPILQADPVIDRDRATFTQTAGGRTGAPLPRRIDRPPFIRITAPTAWTTLSLTLKATGETTFELVGASPFPRHWIYDDSGGLAAKTGLIDFAEWTGFHDHDRTPWHDYERAALMTDVESQVERSLSKQVMSSRPQIMKIPQDQNLITQGEPGSHIYLVLDGVLEVDVDGNKVAELGPGAVVGERAILETGLATATVTAVTPVRAARIPVTDVDRAILEEISEGHRRETEGSSKP